MQVILLERIAKLGSPGQEVSVKRGFARNWLLPQKKALPATASNRAQVEKLRTEIEARDKSRRSEADQIATAFEGKRVFLERAAGENEQLYGSVRARDIALAVKQQLSLSLSKGQVLLETPIRQLGIVEIGLSIHPEVSTRLEVNIARSREEADSQAASLDQARAKAALKAEKERLEQIALKEQAQKDKEEKAAEKVAKEQEQQKLDEKPDEETEQKAEKKTKSEKKPKASAKTIGETEKPAQQTDLKKETKETKPKTKPAAERKPAAKTAAKTAAKSEKKPEKAKGSEAEGDSTKTSSRP